MKLTKGLISTINHFIHSNKSVVSTESRLGLFLFEQGYADIGIEDGLKQCFHFSVIQKRHLFKQLKIDYGEQIFNQELGSSNRFDVAKISNNEKLAQIEVDQEFVLVKSICNDLSCFMLNHSRGVNLPIGTALRCKVCTLDLEKIRQIIVVENLIIFDHIEQVTLPEDIDNALIVYRGHDKNTSKGCKTLLSLLNKPTNDTNNPSSFKQESNNEQSQFCQVIAFCDYDPKGLEIVNTMPNVSHFIFPILTIPKDITKQYQYFRLINHRDDYFKQQASVDYFISRQKQIPLSLFSQFEQIQRHKLSVKQEHMLVHKMALKLSAL